MALSWVRWSTVARSSFVVRCTGRSGGLKPCDRRRFVPTWLPGKAFTASHARRLLIENSALLACLDRKLTELARSERSANSEDLHS
jgi:hypothetical protein